ncbi:helix-turn-helix domain-containing protein [uncultured Spongiibacter sp.]|uniref:TetR/AcrR family transcriptional regulator n=1 Tax=Spongiibacter marinus TaxID=354246 RepID=UPI0025983F0A|nr:helix-turn-helix domain-containing protein [uncultured Spongiibacter sp.]
MTTDQHDNLSLSSGALQLVLSAEQLIADKGIDGVSSREVARAAGHKNHSAVNYNFGSFDGLIEAIIDYRVRPINQQREVLLAALLEQQKQPTLYALVDLMARPLASELLRGNGESRYLSLIAQLLSRGHWRELFLRNRARSSALIKISELMAAQLADTLPSEIYNERVRLLGSQIIYSIAEWDNLQHKGQLTLDENSLEWRLQNLIEYAIGGLTANHNKRI